MRWDSLGEFLALYVSLEDLAEKTADDKTRVLAKALDNAITKFLENGKSPSRKAGELDNRGSHFYLALYWAQELAGQTENKELQANFSEMAKSLKDNENKIVDELSTIQGQPVDMGGYFMPDTAIVEKLMRPSDTLNGILSSAFSA